MELNISKLDVINTFTSDMLCDNDYGSYISICQALLVVDDSSWKGNTLYPATASYCMDLEEYYSAIRP